MTENEQDVIWIKTQPTHDGNGYVITLDFTADSSLSLTPTEATAYAMDVLTAVHRAEYDTAIMRQLTPMTDKTTAYQLVSDLRADRKPLTHTGPLTLEPGVALDGDSFRPFITLAFNGKPFGQWDLETARGHALGMLEVQIATDLDEDYLRALVDLIGLDRDVAMNVVGDIAKHR